MPSLSDQLQPQEAWLAEAACREADPDTFFPEKGASANPALKLCSSCLVKAECLTYALETDQRFGVWGGTTETDRRRHRLAVQLGVPSRLSQRPTAATDQEDVA
jgi:WhiB family transcriptional regulator, redox-sensing transcriptional regulator